MKFERISLQQATVVAYIVAAAITFGHCYANVHASTLAKCGKLKAGLSQDLCYADIHIVSISAAALSGLVWPLYLSIQYWEKPNAENLPQ